MEEAGRPRVGLAGIDRRNPLLRLETSPSRRSPPGDHYEWARSGAVCGARLWLCRVLCSNCHLKVHRVLQLGLIAVLWLDVFTHSPNLNPTAPCSALEPDTIRQFFKWDNHLQAGTSRALESPSSYWKMVTRLAGDPQMDIYGRRLSLFADLNLLDHAAKFDGFYPLDLKEYGEVFNLVDFTTNNTARLQDFAGISITGNPTNAVDWTPGILFCPDNRRPKARIS